MDKYEFVSLSLDRDEEEVVEAFRDIYLTREPTTLGIGATPEDLVDFYIPVVKECLKSGMSIGAIYKPSGKLVGIRLNKILTPVDNTAFDGHVSSSAKNEKEAIMQSLYNEVDNAVNIFHKYNVQKVLELAFLFTHSDHGGKGIGKALIERSEVLGVNNVCQLANVIASSVITQAIFTKRGYDTYFTYDFSKNSNIDLNRTEGSKGLLMMAKKL